MVLQNGITMTSLDMAEITGKRHADVMRYIRKEIELLGKINESIFGFWHMGQFAKDYRHYFGELPSVTLKKT